MKRYIPYHWIYLSFLAISVQFFTGCTENDSTVTIPPVTDPLEALEPFEREVVNYFTEIALGFEFGNASSITRKWVSPAYIFVEGEPSTTLTSELETIIAEINSLTTDGFELKLVSTKDSSNFRVFFGSGEEYALLRPSAADFIPSNRGLFFVSWNSNQDLISGDVYVNTTLIEEIFQRHLLREELTQSLGLAMDSRLYPESIFQQSWTDVTQYAPIDKALIELLYHPKMTSNLDKTAATEILIEILLEN